MIYLLHPSAFQESLLLGSCFLQNLFFKVTYGLVKTDLDLKSLPAVTCISVYCLRMEDSEQSHSSHVRFMDLIVSQ